MSDRAEQTSDEHIHDLLDKILSVLCDIRDLLTPVEDVRVEEPLDPLAGVELSALPSYGDHMTWESFLENVRCGGFTDDDGNGCLATETRRSHVDVCPSDVDSAFNKPPWATHVVWFNK